MRRALSLCRILPAGLALVSWAAARSAPAQQVTLLAVGDIEWSRAVKPPDVLPAELSREGEGEWREIPFLNSEKSVAYLKALGVRVRGPGDEIEYGLDFASKEEEARHPFQKIAPLLRSADITFGNLEGPLSDRARHTGAFRTPTHFAQGLGWAGFDIVALANNHALDAGQQGLFDTMESLWAQGIGWVGAGRDLESARRPFIIEKNGIRIAFLGYTTHVNIRSNQRMAGFAVHGRSGVVPLDPLLIREDIARVRDQVDYVILSFHWGPQNTQEVHPVARRIAQGAVDAGADIILGHHPHMPQGIELYGGGVIIHSLGNFVFGHNHDYWINNIAARLTLAKTGIAAFEVLPVAGKGHDLAQPYVLEGEEAVATLEDVRDRSAELGTTLEISGAVGIVSLPRKGRSGIETRDRRDRR